MPRYSVHLRASDYTRDYVACDTLAQAKKALRRFAGINEPHPLETSPAASADQVWAVVCPYDSRDNADTLHADYPDRIYEIGPRGGIRDTAI